MSRRRLLPFGLLLAVAGQHAWASGGQGAPPPGPPKGGRVAASGGQGASPLDPQLAQQVPALPDEEGTEAEPAPARPAAAPAGASPGPAAPAGASPGLAAPPKTPPPASAPAPAPPAAATPGSATSPSAAAQAPIPSPGRHDETSEANRYGKTFSALVDLGSQVAPLPSAGLSVGYYLRHDLSLEAAYERGLLSLWFIKAYSETLELRGRYFVGNSFNVTGGVARRAIGASFTPTPLVGSEALSASAELDYLTLDTAIGNMWQWRHFTFGVDWLGIQWPLAKLGSHDDFPGEAVSEWARNKKEQLYDDVAGGRSYALLRFYFGASF